jgi:hypothetical protein
VVVVMMLRQCEVELAIAGQEEGRRACRCFCLGAEYKRIPRRELSAMQPLYLR